MSQAERATVPFQRASLHPASHLEPFLEFISTFLPLDILLPHFPLRFKSRALKSSLETLDAGVGCGHGTCAELGWLGHNSLCPKARHFWDFTNLPVQGREGYEEQGGRLAVIATAWMGRESGVGISNVWWGPRGTS